MAASKTSKPGSAGSSGILPGPELLRGLACLQVFLTHIYIVLMYHSQVKMSPAFWRLQSLDWAYEAVMVFFILSGFVIATSHLKKHRNFLGFMRARFRRLGPLYLIAVAVSFGLAAWLYPPPAYNSLWGHLVFIQSSNIAPTFSTNAPLWSLSYEFYFYLLFAFTIGKHQQRLLWGWFIAALVAVILSVAGIDAPGLLGFFQHIFAMSSIWLLGVFLAQGIVRAGPNIVQHLMLFGMLPLVSHSLFFLGKAESPAHSLAIALMIVPLFYTAVRNEPAQPRARPFGWIIVFGLYTLLALVFLMNSRGEREHTETIFALSVPFLFLLLLPLYRLIRGNTPFFTPGVKNFALHAGRMSYAVYIIHFPVFIALGAFMTNAILQIVADIAIALPLAWFLEYRVHPACNVLFDRYWPENTDEPSLMVPSK